jgi:hypothetical protein
MWRPYAAAMLLCAYQCGAGQAFEVEAELEVFAGQVLVSTPAGQIPAEPKQNIGFGDSITLLTGAAVVISYPDTGCFLTLRDAGTFTIPDLSQCSGGVAARPDVTPMISPANGGYASQVALSEPNPQLLQISNSSLPSFVVGNTFFATVFAVAGYQTVVNNQKKPISSQ